LAVDYKTLRLMRFEQAITQYGKIIGNRCATKVGKLEVH